MPRGISDSEQFVEAYRLYTAGYKQAQILEKLNLIYRSNSIKLRTLGDWIKKFKELSDEEKENSQSIQWHDLDDYGMGWEIGRGIGYFHDWEGHMPSRRLIKWWWRLNQIGGWSDEKLMLWAKKYEEYEIKTAFGIKSESLASLDEQMLSNRRDTTGITAGTVTNNSSEDNNHKEDHEMSDISSNSTLETPRPRNVRGYSSFQKID
ncbi:MAG: hypothetical protein CL782_03585 [Chloroflexi bacterium]|nr:hypothetical protein [Chloroflexota bacterium]|tara:strand:+ start:1709 stop:2326 length:618 start_codon:yes stop_codon:yes gene_type:complete